MTFISYAQNFEDVMLWRALKHVDCGVYVDLGAQDPVIDSVSKSFHERGWRGIHVEPTIHYAALLRKQRPGDVVIQAAVADSTGILSLFEIPNTGISTLDREIADKHRARGFDINEVTTPVVSLSSILEAAKTEQIHWMKIDVEGFERQVLTSWNECEIRPWIVVVESTLPLTQIESHKSWEALLLTRGYIFTYFDGLNRYYISEAHKDLLPSFSTPPNVFDEFSLNGTASATFHHTIKNRFESQISVLNEASGVQAKKAQDDICLLMEELALGKERWITEAEELKQKLASITTTLAQQICLTAQGQALLMNQQQLSQIQAERNEVRVNALRLETESSRVRVADLFGELDRLRLRHAQDAAAVVAAKRALETALEGARQEVDGSQQRVHALQNELSRQGIEVASLEAEIDRLHSERAAESVAIEIAKHSLEKELERARQEIAKGQERGDVLQSKLSFQSTENLSLSAEVNQLRDRLEKSKSIAALTAEKMFRLTAERTALHATVSSLQASVFGRLVLALKRPLAIPPLGAVEEPAFAAVTNDIFSYDPVSSPIAVSRGQEAICDGNFAMNGMPFAPPTHPNNEVQRLLTLFDLAFVKEAYLTLLGREADPDGLNYYLQKIRQGDSREFVILSLAVSDEGSAKIKPVSGVIDLVARMTSSKYSWPFRKAVNIFVVEALTNRSKLRRRVSGRMLRSTDDLHLRTLRALENRLAVSAAAHEAQLRRLEATVGRLADVAQDNLASVDIGPRSTDVPVQTASQRLTTPSAAQGDLQKDIFQQLLAAVRR